MRKEKKYHYIYKTVNILSGKYYIGMHSTSNLDDGYLGSGTRLRYSINKHGKDNHKVEILEFVDTREELKKREEEIVNLNEIAKVDCMNLKVGGQGGFSSEEHRVKALISSRVSFKKNLTENEEYRNKVFKTLYDNCRKAYKDGKLNGMQNFKGKKHSEESKEKMRKPKNVGQDNSQFGKCWITNENENKKIYRGDNIPSGWRLGRKMKK